jgi:hypothetical protein
MESIFLVDILNKLDSNTYVFIHKNKSYSYDIDTEGLHLNIYGGETLYKGRICDMTGKDYAECMLRVICTTEYNSIIPYYMENGIIGFKIIVDI